MAKFGGLDTILGLATICRGLSPSRPEPGTGNGHRFSSPIVRYVPHTHTHTHPFNGPLSRTTWVSRYQKGKTSLDFTGARDSEWQWHQLGHMRLHLAPDR